MDRQLKAWMEGVKDGNRIIFSAKGKLRAPRYFYQEMFRERGEEQEQVETYLEGLEGRIGDGDSAMLEVEGNLAEAEAAMVSLKRGSARQIL